MKRSHYQVRGVTQACVRQVTCAGGRRRGARGAGPGSSPTLTGPRQETAGEGIPARAQWRRRAAGGALAIDMPSLRSDGRCERFGALQRRMPLAPRAAPRAHHTCCVFIERHSRRRDAGMSTLPRPSTSTYLCAVGTHAMFARTPPRPLPPCRPGDARLFIICHNEHKNSTRSLSTILNTLFATPTVQTIITH